MFQSYHITDGDMPSCWALDLALVSELHQSTMLNNIMVTKSSSQNSESAPKSLTPIPFHSQSRLHPLAPITSYLPLHPQLLVPVSLSPPPGSLQVPVSPKLHVPVYSPHSSSGLAFAASVIHIGQLPPQGCLHLAGESLTARERNGPCSQFRCLDPA